jgi:hypothetical protein
MHNDSFGRNQYRGLGVNVNDDKNYSERTESGLTAIHEGRMLARAIEKGWVTGSRWPTREMLESGDHRTMGIGLRVVMGMECQNQADEHVDAKAADQADTKFGGDTFNTVVGSIELGQEPLTCDDARRQAQEVLARVHTRIGLPSPQRSETIMMHVTPAKIGHNDLADL